jgi:hypothetical protein
MVGKLTHSTSDDSCTRDVLDRFSAAARSITNQQSKLGGTLFEHSRFSSHTAHDQRCSPCRSREANEPVDQGIFLWHLVLVTFSVDCAGLSPINAFQGRRIKTGLVLFSSGCSVLNTRLVHVHTNTWNRKACTVTGTGSILQ